MIRAFARRARTAIRRRRDLTAAWNRASTRERVELVRFGILIPIITLSLRIIGFNRTRALLAASSRLDATPRADAADIAARGLLRARRYAPYRGNCLPQSLALWWRLRRQGIDAHLCLGARIDAGEIAAHAWVEAGAGPMNDTADVRQRFSQFVSDPTSSPLR